MKHWRDRAYAAIEREARTFNELYVDNILMMFSEPPPHPNCWGAVWLKAIRNGLIERTGETLTTADRGKHRHRYPVYRSLVVA